MKYNNITKIEKIEKISKILLKNSKSIQNSLRKFGKFFKIVLNINKI